MIIQPDTLTKEVTMTVIMKDGRKYENCDVVPSVPLAGLWSFWHKKFMISVVLDDIKEISVSGIYPKDL